MDKYVTLVEQHIIKKSHPSYKEIIKSCETSKKLYNSAIYFTRQNYFETKKFEHSLSILDQTLKKDDEVKKHYYGLPTKVSQQTLKIADQNWKSYHGLMKYYLKQENKNYKIERPSFPKYIKNNTFMLQYNRQSISKKSFYSEGLIKLSGNDTLRIKPQNIKLFEDIKVVRLIPKNKRIVVEVIYEKRINKKNNLKKNKVLGIDIGVDNLATCTTNIGDPFIINGKPLKSINQFYNKKKAFYSSSLPGKQKTSNRISQLTNKRNSKIKDYMHKSSRHIINYCLTNNIGRIIIGNNKGWKQKVNLGKRTNQKFVSIPFKMFIDMLKYKGKLEDIEVIIQEEAYTSKCSFIDHEHIKKHKTYSGKRVKRGLFKTKEGYLINADVNGSFNIVEKWRRKSKKVVPNFQPWKEGIEGFVVNPLRKTVDINC